MLGIYPGLAEAEAQAYKFVQEHSPMIKELSSVFTIINELLEVLKKKGLSYATIASCIKRCGSCKDKLTDRVKLLLSKIKAYLKLEKTKLPDMQTIWHNSSDIIESLFGCYKIRKACNTLHGVTPFVLLLPLLTRTDTENNTIRLNFREVFQCVYMKDLKQWSKDHLIENQVVRRGLTFKSNKQIS